MADRRGPTGAAADAGRRRVAERARERRRPALPFAGGEGAEDANPGQLFDHGQPGFVEAQTVGNN